MKRGRRIGGGVFSKPLVVVGSSLKPANVPETEKRYKALGGILLEARKRRRAL